MQPLGDNQPPAESMPHPAAALSQDELSRERTQITRLLGDPGHRRSRMPDELDQAYREYVVKRAIHVMRANTWTITLFYLLIGFITYEQVRLLSSTVTLGYDLTVWLILYLGGALAFGTIGVLVHRPSMDRFYTLYMGAVSFFGLTGMIIASSAFLNPYLNQHSTYIVIFIFMLMYSLSSMRLLATVIVGSLSAGVGLVILQLTKLSYDLGQFLQYAGLTNLIGAAIAYMIEQRDRTSFLQSRLIEIEKRQLDRLSQEMARLSREDGLTTLANRRHFNETLAREWAVAEREQQPISLVFVDVDHFKAYNDTYGHLDGDKVLASVGRALKTVAKRPADMAARYGGEEFVLLLPNTDIDGSLEVAREVLNAIDALAIPHKSSKAARHVSVSIGLSTIVPGSGNSISTLIDQADEGVYAAKKAGRHRIRAWHLLKSRNTDAGH